jgi:hypothetical protein
MLAVPVQRLMIAVNGCLELVAMVVIGVASVAGVLLVSLACTHILIIIVVVGIGVRLE